MFVINDNITGKWIYILSAYAAIKNISDKIFESRNEFAKVVF